MRQSSLISFINASGLMLLNFLYIFIFEVLMVWGSEMLKENDIMVREEPVHFNFGDYT